MKGLIKWFYDLIIDIMDWAGDELMKVMDMDLEYFEQTAPVIKTMTTIIIAVGWALLLGNLIYQAIRTMLHGAGFESEDPKILACRTAVFAFLLIVSRDVCNIGLSVSGQIIEWLQFPTELGLVIPAESSYDVGSSARWLIAIIVGFILIFQIVKLLFEIGERYVVVAILTYFSPLAFGMGGSKNTQDIFKAWCRMYCSMLVMMIMSTVFLKLIISAMEHAGDGNILVWLIFVVAVTRVARKIDSHIAKIGLNPAITGDGLGSRIPGMLTAVAVRSMASTIRHNGQMGRVPVSPSSPGNVSAGGGRPGGFGSSSFSSAVNTQNNAANGVNPANANSSAVSATAGSVNTSRTNERQPVNSMTKTNTQSSWQQASPIRPSVSPGKPIEPAGGRAAGPASAPKDAARMGTQSQKPSVENIQGIPPGSRGNGTQQGVSRMTAHSVPGVQPAKGAVPSPGMIRPQPGGSTNIQGKPGGAGIQGSESRPGLQSAAGARPGATPQVSSPKPVPTPKAVTGPTPAAVSPGNAPHTPAMKAATPSPSSAAPKINVPAGGVTKVTAGQSTAQEMAVTHAKNTVQVQNTNRKDAASKAVHSSSTKMVSPKAYESGKTPETSRQKLDPSALNQAGATYRNKNQGPKRGDKH